MDKSLFAVIVVGGLFVFFGISTAFFMVNTYNSFTKKEETIAAQYQENQNNYAQMFNKIKEVAQVPSMYTDDLKKVFDSAMQGRYGQNGSKAMFQWIQEHNPTVDSSIYKQIQQVIEASRNDFEANQKTLLELIKLYKQDLRVFPNNLVANVFGFPRINFKNFKIVTNKETEKAFSDGKADPIKLRD